MTETLLSMYSLKPVQEPNEIFHYTSNMYGMKNLVDPAVPLKTGSINKYDDDIYSEVERSQTIIFEYIQTIKKQIEELRRILLKRSGKSADTEIKSTTNEMCEGFKKSGITHEVVINGDIECPPYSLLVLHRLTKDLVTLKITQHRHSSLNALPEIFDKFNDLSRSINGSHTLNIRLIWKKGGGTSVVLGHVPLCGEVSLLRFVHTCLNVSLNPSEDTDLQRLLDNLNNDGASSFDSIVKGTNYLIGDKLTIIDIALWSALKRSKPSGKLQQWFQHFDKILFQ